MLGINWREVAWVTLGVVLVFGSVIGELYLPQPYSDTLQKVWHAATLLVVTFLIIRWIIRRRRH